MTIQIYEVNWSKFEELMDAVGEAAREDSYDGAPVEVAEAEAKDELRAFVEKIVTDLRGY